METKFKKLTSFESLALLGINKEIKKCFGDFCDIEVIKNETRVDKVEKILISNYTIMKNFEVDFLNKKAEIKFPFLIRLAMGVKDDDKIVTYFGIQTTFEEQLVLLDWRNFAKTYNILIKTKEIGVLLNEIAGLIDTIMKNKGYKYEIIIKDTEKIEEDFIGD